MASVGNYAKNHNRILKKYRRHSLWILWGVAFSVVCLTIFLPSTDFYMLKRYTQDTSIDTDGLMGFSFGGFINISSLPCFYYHRNYFEYFDACCMFCYDILRL